MKELTMVVKPQHLNNLAYVRQQGELLSQTLDLESLEYSLTLDYSNINNDVVITPTTTLAIKQALEIGFKQVIVKGHPDADKIKQTPLCGLFAQRGQLKFTK